MERKAPLTEPIISIVTGTYQRRAYLENMIGSVRDTVPVGLPVEFVVVDGGSTDGTLEWCKSQSDIRLIEHGALLGAIKAFTDGAKAASAPYVIMANDDVRFHQHGIVAALAHLETHPECGAVAFADNRATPGYAGGDYKVQSMTARDSSGKSVSVPYAQVGMFRKFLGDIAGWWGADHPIMSTGHTYGSDNFLSARIWELGYTVDDVPECRIDDYIPRDALRERNYAIEQRNPAVYYRVYPQGPEIPDAPQVDNPQGERLRILYAPLFEPGYPHQTQTKRGLREALQQVGLVYEWNYLLDDTPGLAERAAAWQPHLILLQLHGIDRINEADLVATRDVCPDAVIVNWNGDVYGEHLISAPMLSLLRHVDLQLVVNASVLPIYAEHGIKAAYWQVAYEPTDAATVAALKARVPAHDVVFLGNAYTRERKQLGDSLRAMRDTNLRSLNIGLYGFGWNQSDGSTLYEFNVGAALYQNAAIAIGDNDYLNETGFVSNRFFEALAAGAFLLHQRVNGLEDLTGLKAGVHYAEWQDADDLQRQIQHWLKPKQDAKRREIAAAGQMFVREHHSFEARVKELFEVLLPMIDEPVEEAEREPV